MTTPDTRADLVPLHTDFDLVLRGYDRDQVRHYVASVEDDLRLLATDRDAAVTRAEELTRQLEAERSRNRELAERLRRRHEHLVAELDARRQEMKTEHRQLMRRAREQAETTTRQAEQRRRELDEQAAGPATRGSRFRTGQVGNHPEPVQ